MATLPNVPSMPAGIVASSADMTELATACSFLLGSASGANPFWLLTQTTGQAITANANTAINFTSATKDNDGVWSSSAPSRATIVTPGFYSIDWGVSLPSGSASLAVQAWATITTTANNPYNPSAQIQFQYTSFSSTSTSGNLIAHGGGLVPSWLNVGDFINIAVNISVAGTTVTSQPSYFHGELVSE